jgi:tetratricopeptide (TPR) repeat protein
MDEAVRWCREGHRRFPEEPSFFACHLFMMSLSGGARPDVPTAWALQDTFLQLSSPQQRKQLRPVTEAWVAAALARAGLGDSAVAVAKRARAAADDDLKPWLDYYVANVHLLLGQRDEALDLLAAFLNAIPQRREYIPSDWMFRDLWEDPRFKALVAERE